VSIYDDPRAPAPDWLCQPVTAQIDHAALDRIAAGVAEYRAESPALAEYCRVNRARFEQEWE
jgi:hypothetical protein